MFLYRSLGVVGVGLIMGLVILSRWLVCFSLLLGS